MQSYNNQLIMIYLFCIKIIVIRSATHRGLVSGLEVQIVLYTRQYKSVQIFDKLMVSLALLIRLRTRGQEKMFGP